MGRRILFTNLRLVGIALCLFFISANAPAQTAGSVKAETGPVLITLSTPKYPPLARVAHIIGEVKVTASLRMDGAIELAEATGHPLLKQAALESVQKSTFECRGCTKEAARLLTFSFEIKDEGDCCVALSRPAEVTQLGDRIIITAAQCCTCDPAVRKVHSLKCLYLWRCGSR